MRAWSQKTELSADRFIRWVGVARGKFFDWRKRYGKANEHNALVPRDHWIEPAEREKICAFHDQNPPEGYRRLTFMMIDADIVAVSPATTYRVLSAAGRLDRWNRKPSKKGTGSEESSRSTRSGTPCPSRSRIRPRCSVPTTVETQALVFVSKNRDVLLEHWNGEIDTGEVIERLQPV